MKNVVLFAAAAFVFATSNASAFEVSGKIKDLPKDLKNSLTSTVVQHLNMSQKDVTAATKIAEECQLDFSSSAEESSGKLVCPNGLKADLASYSTSSGIYLKAGTCSEISYFLNRKSIFGYKNASTVCNLGTFGGFLPKDMRMRITVSAFIPKAVLVKAN